MSIFTSKLPLPIIIVTTIFSAIMLTSLYLFRRHCSYITAVIIRWLFTLFVSVECIVLAVLSSAVSASSDAVSGIPLASLYMVMFIFIPFLEPYIEMLVCIEILMISVWPNFTPYRAGYGLTENLVLGISVITACIAFRRVFVQMMKESCKLSDEQKKLKVLTKDSLEILASTIDAKNNYLQGHSKRVAEYSRDLGEKLGLEEEKLEAVYYAGLLHDLGKIGIPDSILDKPDKLTSTEYSQIKQHTVIGYEMLQGREEFSEVAIGVKWHHERYDGKGYPDGLSGEDIPLLARIVCIADCYDAMASSRTYDESQSREYTISELKKGKGKQFDPVLVDSFLELLGDLTLEDKASNVAQA